MMNQAQETLYHYFADRSGVGHPFNLTNKISVDNLHNHNTYYRGTFDADGKLLSCDQIVYGAEQSWCRYEYYPNGVLKHAHIANEYQAEDIYFDKMGGIIAG